MTMLQPSEAQLRCLIDQTLHGFLFTDEDGRIVFHNEAVVRMFGYETTELCGLEIGALLPADLGVGASELPEPMRPATCARGDGTARSSWSN
jgi:PAS domain S-box-containing protein